MKKVVRMERPFYKEFNINYFEAGVFLAFS